MYKQYPTVREMVGMFQNLGQQKLQRENLERQKKRDKLYGKQITDQIKYNEARRRLMAEQQKAASIKDWFNMRQKMQDAMVEAAENKRAINFDIASSAKGTWSTYWQALGPGESETDEMFALRKLRDTSLKKAAGQKPIDIARSQQNMTALTKPEKKLSEGQKVQAFLQLADEAPEIAAKPLGKALGIDIDPEALNTKKVKELRDSMAPINRAYEKGLFESKEDYLTAARNIMEGKLAYKGVDITPRGLSDLSATVFSSVVGPEKILQKGTPSREEADLAARRLTAKSPPGIRYKTVRDDSLLGLGYEHYAVVEDIPVGLETTWYNMTSEEKETARNLLNQGIGVEKIIEAIKND